MNLTELIQHPERMDRETLYDLRSLLALHPCFQTARLLLLQNLYILHDSSFDEELRKAAIYITDRRVIFNMIEAAHYKLRTIEEKKVKEHSNKENTSRTISLIEDFLETIPVDESENARRPKRKPTPADAAVDYVSYLLEVESEEAMVEKKVSTPQMRGQSLIDNFINNEGGSFTLQDTPEYLPQLEENTSEDVEQVGEEGYFTETLAKIYIKQARYSKALEIIKRLNLNYPKKNAYFADQIRFLEKLILNESHAKRK